MKGIILAGGSGTRLYPATLSISKQLLPVFDKPMIYYPMSLLMLAGIREILIISTPRDLPMFRLLLGDGSAFGIDLSYAEQQRPEGLPQAYSIAEPFLRGEASALILGDNIFYGDGLPARLQAAAGKPGATIFATHVENPGDYGVLAFHPDGRPRAVVEKPIEPPSSWAVTGLYFCDGNAPEIARSLRPSQRGETEIVDLLRHYLANGELTVDKLGRGIAWLDTGTHDSLHEASSFVRTLERRQGIKIACPEEIALNAGWLDADAVLERARTLGGTGYAHYLRELAVAA